MSAVRSFVISAVRSIVGLLLLFLLSISSFPVAQSRADARLRLVTAKQGESIVLAAWELRRGLNPKPDCSHFVQAVYAKAGFPYEYKNTRDVFTGIDGFRRVQKPQPGDLVVWLGQPGHIGIVIDPGEHSFYSSVLSGFAIENYQSHYWTARGIPRFYRFVVTDPQKDDLEKNDLQKAPRTLRAGATQAHPAANVHPASTQAPALETQRSPASSPSQKPGVMATVAAAPKQPLSGPGTNQKPALMTTAAATAAVAGSPKGKSGQPAQSADSRKGASQQPVQTADASKGVSQQPVQTADASKGVSQQPVQTADSTKGGSQQAVQITDLPKGASRQPAQIAESPKGKSGQPAQIAAPPSVQSKAGAGTEVFVTSQATPTRRDVLAAINWSVNDYSERLLRDRLLESQPSVGVADHFRLASLELQDHSGLAEVEVTEIAAFHYGKPASSRVIATKRVILSRQDQGWILLLPQDLMYLNRHTAAVALTNQLATLSKAPADQLQARKTSKILHELLAEKSAGVNPGGTD